MIVVAVLAAALAGSAPASPGWRDFFGQARVEPAPAAVQRLVQRLQGCGHFGGEDGYDRERTAEIAHALRAMRCAQLPADVRRARLRHARDRRTLALIDAEAGLVGL